MAKAKYELKDGVCVCSKCGKPPFPNKEKDILPSFCIHCNAKMDGYNNKEKEVRKMTINEYIDSIEKMMLEEDGYTREEATEITSTLRDLFKKDETKDEQ